MKSHLLAGMNLTPLLSPHSSATTPWSHSGQIKAIAISTDIPEMTIDTIKWLTNPLLCNLQLQQKIKTTITRVIFTAGLIAELSNFSSALQICWYSCSYEWKCCFYLLLFLSLTCPPGSRICPFFSQVSWGSGSPWAWQVKMAVVPTGRAMDCGGWTNSAGAERAGGNFICQFCWDWSLLGVAVF